MQLLSVDLAAVGHEIELHGLQKQILDLVGMSQSAALGTLDAVLILDKTTKKYSNNNYFYLVDSIIWIFCPQDKQR